MTPWEITVDTGGTFTDCLALDPSGTISRVKLLSSGILRARILSRPSPTELELAEDWKTPPGFFVGFHAGNGATAIAWSPTTRILTIDRETLGETETIELDCGEEAPVLGARLLTRTPLAAAFPPLVLRLATTRATNALLEGKTAPTALFITRGFSDLLLIGDQRRPDLFALHHRKPVPLFTRVVEVGERLDAHGNVLVPLDPQSIRAEALQLVAEGVTCAAIALAHSYRNPSHEEVVAEALAAAGFEHVSRSSALAPLIRLLPRAQTAVVDACLSPVLSRFVDAVAKPLGEQSILMMTSAGGLIPAADFRPKDSLLSGPAGGAVGAAAIARAAGFSKVIAFDMGGTSTDVSRIEGELPYQFEQRVGAATLFAPSVKIETVAAGGGSICALKPGGLAVGPESASADPGPACYGRGGPLTLTDVNLLLGHLDPAKAGIPLDPIASGRRLAELRDLMVAQRLEVPSEQELLRGLLEIGIERMADAIRRISLREGCEPADYALVAFGGAGPQHACAVAEKLGIDRILVPRDAGLLSAYGLRCARIEKIAERQILAPFDPDAHQSLLTELEALHPLPVVRRIAELRLAGQDSTLAVDFARLPDLPGLFHDRHIDLFGYEPPSGRALELVSLRVVSARTEEPPPNESFEEEITFKEPRLIQDAFSTLVIGSGWQGRTGSQGTIILERTANRGPSTVAPREVVEMELYRSRLSSIVEEMGVLLRRTAISTNVKERADFSCALLDAKGELVMNAPHIPVHLGALGLCVREVARHLDIGPGDMVITNHPAFGGSHLPDVTVISAAFDAEGQRIAYVANRAHHAEIGGITPGSMPPGARSLDEEGVVIAPRYLFRQGEARFQELAELLARPPFPTRRLADNLADLNAQAAANLRAVRALEILAPEKTRRHMEGVLERSRSAFRDAWHAAEIPHSEATEHLDDGTTIHVRIEKKAGRLRVDFTGTHPETLPGNLNATPAITRSAVLYVLRLLIREDLPLNEGLLRDVDIILPPCFLNPFFDDDPRKCPAVVGGNVETSQRIVDTLLKALQFQACSQGTMNNFLFGSERFGYYETIAGGAGAGPGYHGADALHTHMTNTAITDIEILESRYPVRVRHFGIRNGSGGLGKWHGGNGIVREIEFLAPLTISLLTQHRNEGPYGLDGGEKGSPGVQALTHPDGTTEFLPHIAQKDVAPGTVLRIETPGGGAFGAASTTNP